VGSQQRSTDLSCDAVVVFNGYLFLMEQCSTSVQMDSHVISMYLSKKNWFTTGVIIIYSCVFVLFLLLLALVGSFLCWTLCGWSDGLTASTRLVSLRLERSWGAPSGSPHCHCCCSSLAVWACSSPLVSPGASWSSVLVSCLSQNSSSLCPVWRTEPCVFVFWRSFASSVSLPQCCPRSLFWGLASGVLLALLSRSLCSWCVLFEVGFSALLFDL
jgi:hypothetical protein